MFGGLLNYAYLCKHHKTEIIMNALTLIISTAFQELRQPLTKLFVQDGGEYSNFKRRKEGKDMIT